MLETFCLGDMPSVAIKREVVVPFPQEYVISHDKYATDLDDALELVVILRIYVTFECVVGTTTGIAVVPKTKIAVPALSRWPRRDCGGWRCDPVVVWYPLIK